MQTRICRMALISSCGLLLGAFAATSAQAATSIHATTQPATSIHATSAVLHGTVGTDGLATAWEFQYGKTKSLGNFTPIRVIHSGRGTVAVSVTITHLSPNTEYHFRLLATTGNGSYYYPLLISRGKILDFRTHRERERRRDRR